MQPKDYFLLSEDEILTLAIWREARGETLLGKSCVGHVIRNRANIGGWFISHVGGPTPIHNAILKPWQFSSFNKNDVNEEKWPEDGSQSESDCKEAAAKSASEPDVTEGATHYYDTSISWPAAWGNESEYINTLNLGHFRFYKLIPVTTHDVAQEAAAEG